MEGLKQPLLEEHGHSTEAGHGHAHEERGHGHVCDEDHGHSHGAGHGHEAGHGAAHEESGHGHVCDEDHGHSHEAGHSHKAGHGAAHEESGHGHVCDEDHGHEKGHGHAHEEHGHGHGHEGSHNEGHEGHGHGHQCCFHGGHGHAHGGLDDKSKMKRAIYFALFFMFLEIVGGIVANSLAIITDAAHMLSDVGGFVVSLLTLQLAELEATVEFSYGFSQAEVLGALLSVMIVWGLTAVLFYEAVCRFLQPEEVDAPIMLAIATIGFIVNLVLMRVLGHGHDHDHDHHHHHGETHGAAMQAAIAHVAGDLIQSLSVCLAAGLMWWRPFDLGLTQSGISKWCYADPCCTVIFCVLVLYTTKSTTLRAVNTLMAKAPKHIDQADFQRKLEAIANVHEVHDLHLWIIGSEVLCTAHVMVNLPEHATGVLKNSISVAQGLGIGHSTFQIEIVGEFDPADEHYGSLHKNPSRRDVEEGGSPRNSPAHGGHGHDGHGGGHGHAH